MFIFQEHNSLKCNRTISSVTKQNISAFKIIHLQRKEVNKLQYCGPIFPTKGKKITNS